MATTIRPFTGTYEIDPVHSTVQFAVEHIVSTFRASFDGVEGRLDSNGGTTTLTASAPVESISIVDPPEFREHVVRGDDFFHADTHPRLTFQSTRIEFRDDGSATVTGELTIRGIARTVTVEGSFRTPTRDPFGNDRVALRLCGSVDRRDWNLSWQLPLPDGGDAVGWDVELMADLELVRAGLT
jgi:polyisoprenoid-binding protein YceI